MTEVLATSSLINVGVIGLGVGERHARFIESDPRARLVAICDFDSDHLAEVGRAHPGVRLVTDWKEVVDDSEIDMVVIASYDDDHAQQVLRAIHRKKSVFVEKPLCTNREELVEICSMMTDNPEVRISSNFPLRKEPRFVALRERIRGGQLGIPYFYEGSYEYGRIEKLIHGWRGNQAEYSVMHGGGIHLIDLLLWLGNETIDEVVAMGSGLATQNSSFSGRDLAVALVQMNGGALATITANFASVTPHHHQVAVYGTEGTFIQSLTGSGYYSVRDSELGQLNIDWEGLPYPAASKVGHLSSFIERLLGRASDAPTEKEVMYSMAVSLAIEASMRERLPMQVEAPRL